VKTLIAIATSLVPSIALAHPGHGSTDPDSWMHHATEPLHVALASAAIAVVIVGSAAWWRSRNRSV
jgi:hypothetical protein